MRSIFRKRNPDVEALFQDAASPTKVMCVAFDYAKSVHTCAVCNGQGLQLRGGFTVDNNKPGLDYLTGIVAGLCRKHAIKPRHVFFGGEDCGSYAFNFIHALVELGYLVVGINTKQAKDERENSRASTDLIDTDGRSIQCPRDSCSALPGAHAQAQGVHDRGPGRGNREAENSRRHVAAPGCGNGSRAAALSQRGARALSPH